MEPTGGTPKLPNLGDIKIPFAVKPRALGEIMTIDAIVTMFVSHMYYKYDERPLDREETSSLMRTYWYTDSYTNSYTMNHDLLDKFEDDTAALTIALLPLGDDRIEVVKAYVDHLFRNLLEEKLEVEARARILSGFRGRLPRIDLRHGKDAILFRKKQLEPYQYLFHYAAVNWGKDHLNEEQIEGVLVFHYKFDSKITKAAIDHCSKVLANPEHSTTMKVAPIAENYRDFFEQKVVKEFEEYEKSKSQGSSSRSMLGLDSLLNVTEALETSTLQAPVDPHQQSPEDQAQGPRAQESLERARRDEKNNSEKGKGTETRRKRPKSPDSGQQYRPKPPPPPPPSAAGPSRPRGSLPYDPTRG